jgi:hypothetical protein
MMVGAGINPLVIRDFANGGEPRKETKKGIQIENNC